MRKGKKRIVLLLILVVGISIGYAALANTIKINGTSVVKGANWNIYWDNVNVDSGSVSGANVITTPTTSGTTTTEVEFSVVLPEPGDYYEFTIDAVNAGSIDAMIEDNGVQNKVYSDSGYTEEATLPDVVRYTVTNLDGSAIESGHVLPKKEGSTPTRETYKVRVEYRNDEEIEASDLDKDNDKTYYFKFSVAYVQSDGSSDSGEDESSTTLVCKKATSLHTETCERTYQGCYMTGYRTGGAKGTTTITYGHTNGTSLVNGQSGGYALDCDLNGNGVVDTDSNGMSTERFYYVSDLYTGTENGVDKFDNDYAVLIYYKSIDTATYYYYGSSDRENWHGPVGLLSYLPERSDWANTKIGLKNTTRNIYTELGTTLITDGSHTIVNPFAYTDKVGRLLTAQELNKGCNIIVGNSTTGELDSCEYLMEDTSYVRNQGCSGASCYYWLETPHTTNSTFVFGISGRKRNVSNSLVSDSYGIRPVIEIKKTDIELD